MRSLLRHLLDLPPRARRDLAIAWLLTVVVAVGITWALSRPGARRVEIRAPVGPAPVDPVTAVLPDHAPDEAREPSSSVLPTPRPETRPAVGPETEPAPRPKPEPPAARDAAAAEPSGGAPGLPPDALDRAVLVDRRMTADERERAAHDAAALLEQHGTFEALTVALESDGVESVRARLLGLRVVQAAGFDGTARDVARALRREHAGVAEVEDTIRRWQILRPRVTAVDSTVSRGRHVTVQGAVENPDVVAVRRVQVVVAAYDSDGSEIAAYIKRVRPKRLDPGETGTFDLKFKGIDPSTIARTRAWVEDYEYEVAVEPP